MANTEILLEPRRLIIRIWAMNHRSELEKRQLEKRATLAFIRAYKHGYKKSICFLHHNAPVKPDVTCSLEHEQLDLEIAHLYGSEQEAMQHLGRDIPQDTLAELRAINGQQDPKQRLVASLNRLLFKKSLKSYDSTRVWLVICNTHPFWRVDATASLKNDLEIPAEFAFEQIWLVNDTTGKDGIVRLYP